MKAAAQPHSPPPTSQAMCFLAELYLADAQHARHVARALAKEVSSGKAGIRCTGLVYVPADEACFLIFEARSADAVSVLGARLGLPFTRVVSAWVLV